MRTLRRTAPLLLVAVLSLGGCGSGSSGSGDEAAAGEAERGLVADGGGDSASYAEAAAPAEEGSDEGAVDPADRRVISTGMVSLLDEDVAAARFEVQKVVDARGGEIAEEKTQTGDEGSVSRSRLVVRVPAEVFDEVMEELEDVARLESSQRSSVDVTTEVIDVEVRIRAQEASLRRIEVLLARAKSIRDIVAIEAQLTSRQAELDSLKQRQAYLADQTSMSTITVFVAEPTEDDEDDDGTSGFLDGLAAGWDGLKGFLVGALTVVGAVLPFAVLLVVVGWPTWVVLRRLRRSRPDQTPDPEPQSG